MLSEYEQYLKAALFICCPMCDEKVCVGRRECQEVQNWIVAQKEKENENG